MRRLSLVFLLAAAGLFSACGTITYDYPPETCSETHAPCPAGAE